MESYVEVAFIQALLVNLLSVLIAIYAAAYPLSIHKCVLYAFIEAALASFCFHPWAAGLLLIVEGLWALLLFRYRLSAYFAALALRLLMIGSCFKLAKGSIYNFTWFPPLDYNPFPCWLVFLIVLFALIIKWGHLLNQLSFIYEIECSSMTFKGYLDSGNNCMIQGYPVMFVHSKVFEKIKGRDIIKGKMHTLSNEVEIEGKLCEVRVKGGNWMSVMVVIGDQHFPMQAECLLNLRQISEVDKHELHKTNY